MSTRLLVHVPSQTLDLIENDELVRRYVVSTSSFGLGAEPGSNKTPTGNFRVAEKIGDDAPPGEIFISRAPTGQFGADDDPQDHVQTRILWLEGLDPDNANTRERYIYIHGTNHEEEIGQAASNGCIRMKNADLIALFDRVPLGAEVVVTT